MSTGSGLFVLGQGKGIEKLSNTHLIASGKMASLPVNVYVAQKRLCLSSLLLDICIPFHYPSGQFTRRWTENSRGD